MAAYLLANKTSVYICDVHYQNSFAVQVLVVQILPKNMPFFATRQSFVSNMRINQLQARVDIMRLLKPKGGSVPVIFKHPARSAYNVNLLFLQHHPKLITTRERQFNKVINFSSVQFQSSSPLDQQSDIDKERQNKKLNLGKVLDVLNNEIPDILTTLISSDMISSDIIFRISPTSHPNLPTFKGYVPYVTTAKTLQLCLTQFILNPSVKVHITKTNVFEADKDISNYGLYKNTTKLVMKWKTCPENCPHLIANEETSKGSKGKHTWSDLDHTSLLISQNYGLINLKLTDDKIERILSGIFVFELDENNEKIKVFTIEDVEIIENKEWIQTTGSAAC